MQINARNANNGLTVDMTQMRGVVVDPVQQTAVVQGLAVLFYRDLALIYIECAQTFFVPVTFMYTAHVESSHAYTRAICQKTSAVQVILQQRHHDTTVS